MTKHDDNQKITTYKIGYYSYGILMGSILINVYLGLFFDIQWAETKELEYLLLLLPVFFYTLVMTVYHRALHQKNPLYRYLAYAWGLFGLYVAYQAITHESTYIVDGQVTPVAAVLLWGLIWISLPATYFIRVFVDKRRDPKDDAD